MCAKLKGSSFGGYFWRKKKCFKAKNLGDPEWNKIVLKMCRNFIRLIWRNQDTWIIFQSIVGGSFHWIQIKILFLWIKIRNGAYLFGYSIANAGSYLTGLIFQGCPCSKCGRPLDPDDYKIMLDNNCPENLVLMDSSRISTQCSSCEVESNNKSR